MLPGHPSRFFLAASLFASSLVATAFPAAREVRFDAIRQHADRVLEHGIDRWSGENTPLFADGLVVETLEPAIWRFEGREYLISNFSSQQNLMRTLVGLSALTGESRYREAAEKATAWMFDHHQQPGGLLPWGGHRFLDLRTLEDVTGFDSHSHELKRHFPYYDLMFAVNPDAANRLVRAIWESHIEEWTDVFYFSRHGNWVARLPEDVWGRPFNNPQPHQRVPRVGGMVHTSNDLMYAAVHAFKHTGDRGALTWARRMGEMWVRARNPDTGLGSYYYHLEPTHYPSTDDPRGFEWPQFARYGEAATSTRLWARPLWPRVVYADATVATLRMAEVLGEEAGAPFQDWGVSALRAFAAADAYDPETNRLNLLLTDGTVTEKGAAEAAPDFFYSFSLGYRFSKDAALWVVARGVARGHGYGDIGERPGRRIALEMDSAGSDPLVLLSFLELYRALGESDYLRMAERIGDNIVSQKFHDGFFVQSPNHRHVRFDDLEPLALLTLEATLRGEPDLVPVYPHGAPYIHGQFDGAGRTYDNRIIWAQVVDGAGEKAEMLKR